MSINMDGSDVTDYASFEYQQIGGDPILGGATGGSVGAEFLYEFEPLASIGGLANNEVAELVYHELQITLEPEAEQGNDQNVSSDFEFRGVFGANIGQGNGFQGLANDVEEQISNTTNGYDAAEDRIFQLFRANGVLPFDDETNGPGGGALPTTAIYEKPWRNLVGRGPVLDSNDDLSLSGFINGSDTVLDDAGANVRVHLVWDVAETDDAGRAFSVPADD